MKGVSLQHTISGMPCSFGLAACTEGVKVTRCKVFKPSGNGEEIWSALYENGCLGDLDGLLAVFYIVRSLEFFICKINFSVFFFSRRKCGKFKRIRCSSFRATCS